jgi:hypothetical protein
MAASEAAASSSSDVASAPFAANAGALPAISIMARDPLQANDPLVAEGELFDDSPLDLNLLLLAAWLPIAGAVLALIMEGSSPKIGRAREPGGEPSLD